MLHLTDLLEADVRALTLPRFVRWGFLAGASVGLVLVAPAPGVESPRATGDASVGRVWLDPSGEDLLFESDDALLEFLRTADIADRDRTKDGINRPEKLLLEKDGRQLHAIFREVDVEKERTRVAGRYHLRFVDHYGADCAAYDLARALGIGNVPPTTIRQIGPNEGSIQVWLENAQDETSPDFRPGSPIGWVKQQWDMELFDNLILNVDRNTGNMLAGPKGDLWLIDHGRAFQPAEELLDAKRVTKVNRQTWDRLQGLSDDELMDTVREHLDVEQLRALVARRALLVELVEGLIAEKGEKNVFY